MARSRPGIQKNRCVRLRAVYCAPMRKTQRRARERQDCEYADLSGDEYSGLLAWSWPLCASPEGLDCIRHHIRREPTASKALDHVLGSNNDLSHEYYMLALVYATVVGARLSRASYEKRLMANTGKTLKSAREFPARIERLAAEIEKMNANPFFRSIHVDSLSLALTRHARFLAERIKFFNATPSLGTQPGLLLSFAVRDWTASTTSKLQTYSQRPPWPWGGAACTTPKSYASGGRITGRLPLKGWRADSAETLKPLGGVFRPKKVSLASLPTSAHVR